MGCASTDENLGNTQCYSSSWFSHAELFDGMDAAA